MNSSFTVDIEMSLTVDIEMSLTVDIEMSLTVDVEMSLTVDIEMSLTSKLGKVRSHGHEITTLNFHRLHSGILHDRWKSKCISL